MKKKEFTIENHEYQQFEANMRIGFQKVIDSNEPLFKVKVHTDLWRIYLDSIESKGRQHYNCSCCKSFIRKYGDLVVINADGTVKSAIWHPKYTPDYFKLATKKLKENVENSPINTVFYSDQRSLGKSILGERSHLSVLLSKNYINRSVLKTANQLMTEKKEEYSLLTAALNEYSVESIQAIKSLILSETLYRSERFIGLINWFDDAKHAITKQSNNERITHLIWFYVAKARTGFCHIKNSIVGTLLEDFQNGFSSEALISRYHDKMSPTQYMRAQSEPTEGELIEAERLVEKLGIAESLNRRYAKLEEIPEFIWRSYVTSSPTKVLRPKGLFSGIIPRKKESKVNQLRLPVSTMTWRKFSEKILPETTKIKARMDHPDRFMALVTENIPNSEAIFQWNNPFSWYYHSGVDGEIKRRVQAAGGQYEENDIRCSLIWENRTDLDLHCITPKGKHIYFNQKQVNNGWLDVDMNVRGETLYPVENIRWSKGMGIEGKYQFYVHNYCDRSQGIGTPYKVELEVGGQVYAFQGELRNSNTKDIAFEFKYKKEQPIKMLTSNRKVNNNWNLVGGSFAEVTAITHSPNQWGALSSAHNGNHTFFLLKDCQDKSNGKGRSFFTEMLVPELREIRKTLEAYTATIPIKEATEATACGIGFNNEADWGLILHVTVNEVERMIRIDRFD